MMATTATGRTFRLTLLGLILALALFLRLYELPLRGLIYWDEGKFALEGVRFAAIFHSHGGYLSPLLGKQVGTAKPTHALLLGLAILVLGTHDYAPLVLDATASLMGVL